MDIEAALTRAGYLLDRYAGCDSTVLRVVSATDLDAVAVLAQAARDLLARDACPPPGG